MGMKAMKAIKCLKALNAAKAMDEPRQRRRCIIRPSAQGRNLRCKKERENNLLNHMGRGGGRAGLISLDRSVLIF